MTWFSIYNAMYAVIYECTSCVDKYTVKSTFTHILLTWVRVVVNAIASLSAVYLQYIEEKRIASVNKPHNNITINDNPNIIDHVRSAH